MVEDKILDIVGKYDYKKGINYNQHINLITKLKQQNTLYPAKERLKWRF